MDDVQSAGATCAVLLKIGGWSFCIPFVISAFDGTAPSGARFDSPGRQPWEDVKKEPKAPTGRDSRTGKSSDKQGIAARWGCLKSVECVNPGRPAYRSVPRPGLSNRAPLGL